MWSIAICVMEEQLCCKLEFIIEVYAKQHFLSFDIEVFQSGEELLHYLFGENKGYVFHIMFLDVKMKGMSGIDVGHIIRNELHNEVVQMVYLSSRIEYAAQLFDVQPLSFLVKPFSDDQIVNTLSQSIKRLQNISQIFYFQFNKVNYAIAHKSILYFESAYDKKIMLVHRDGEFLFYDTMNHVLHSLNSHLFYKIHRGCIINLLHIKYIDNSFVKMENDYQIPIPLRKQKAVIDYMKGFDNMDSIRLPLE